MTRCACLAALLLAVVSPASAGPAAAAGQQAAADDWRTEFDQICAKTQDAMVLSTEELKALVARSDALLPKIERLPEPQRKVMTTRLKSCRNLYQFMVDTREAK